MLHSGVYPASVTPFDAKGRIDPAGVARLLAWFEAAGCRGVVLAGTNGEGPSLSAVEKRDLIRDGAPHRGSLDLILGIATPSLDEAIWLTKRADEFGAAAVLVMPPSYFRAATEVGIRDWFLRLLDATPCPVLAYNFPKMTGFTLSAELFAALATHERLVGLKDSSGDAANLIPFRQAMPEGRVLFVGDERLLLEALRAGWTGTISGAANVIPQWLSQIVAEWNANAIESAEAKFELALPISQAIRDLPQPQSNKATLHRMGLLDRSDPRLPLLPAPEPSIEALMQVLAERLGCTSTA
jgi:dihydrodipicolinate synthase/N-acetylneuraminate lyase